MRYYIRSLFFALILFGRIVHAEQPPVIFNEILWMGSSISSADEWIELRNTTEQDIDLSGWVITRKANGAQVPMVTIPSGKTIPAKGYFVISNYPVGDTSVLTTPPDLVTSDVSLANSDLRLELRTASQEIVDIAGSGNGIPFAGLNIPSEHRVASMERNIEFGDGSSMDSWHTATERKNVLETFDALATPGTENSNGTPTSQFATSWDAVVGQDLILDASDAQDPENDPLSFAWNIGGEQFSESRIIFHPKSAGTIQGTLQISDTHHPLQILFQIVVSTQSDSPIEHTTSSPTSAPKCSGLQFMEVFPNPKGSETSEYTVVKNTLDLDAPLIGCRIQINNSRQYRIEGVVPAHGEFLLRKQKFRLPNTAGLIELITADGTVLDRLQYPKSIEGRSWSRLGNDWGWSQPTPTRPNAVFDPIEATVLGASTAKKTVTRIRVQGHVIAQTGLVGNRYAVILASDGIWLAQTPEQLSLPLDTDVRLVGRQTTHQGFRTISVEGKPVVRKGSATKAVAVHVGDLDEQDAYRFVTITGTVQALRGSSIDFEDDSGLGIISIKTASHIIRPILRAGDVITVDGLVQVGVTGLKILPRQKSDLRVTQRVPLKTDSAVRIQTVDTRTVLWYWIAGGVGLGALAVFQVYQRRKSQKITP